MVKVDLWMLVEGNEFYDYLEFDHDPSKEDVGNAVWNRHSEYTAYHAQWVSDTNNQSRIEYAEENPNYPTEFQEKLEEYLIP